MKIQYVRPSTSVMSADLCSILSASGEKNHACSSYCKLWHICRYRGHGKVCGDDYGYNLFKDKKPKEVAINIIRQVFNGQNIDNMQFAYKPYYYRGRNGLQDRIEVYYRKNN